MITASLLPFRWKIDGLDVAETEKEIVVTLKLPGLEEKDVNVLLSGDQLIISGESREEREENNKPLRRRRLEQNSGSFRRVLPLSLYWEVDRNNIKAIFSQGVLTTTLTRKVRAREMARRIPVKTV